jgi:hypothetical protein
MPSQHIWTEKDRHGTKREVRATKFGGVWRFQSKSADDARWIYHDFPVLADLLKVKEIIERKYRRRRASADDLASIEKLITDQLGRDAAPPYQSGSDCPVSAARPTVTREGARPMTECNTDALIAVDPASLELPRDFVRAKNPGAE